MKLRHEINLLDHVFSFTNAADANERSLLTTTRVSAATYRFEVVAKNSSAISETVTLRRTGTTTDDATISVSSTSSYTRFRSGAFTPPAGATEYMTHGVFIISGQVDVKAARLLPLQDGTITDSESQYEIGNYETGKTNTTDAALTNPKYWLYTAANFDGTVTFEAEVVWKGSGTMYNKSIKLQEADGSFGSWVDHTVIVNASTSSTLTRTRVSFTPISGRNYRLVSRISNDMETYDIYCGKIIVTQTASPTKFQPEYLLANTLFASGTALQDFDTLWDPAEWDGVTNTYFHEGNSVAAGTSDLKLQDTAGPTDVTGSAITDCIERERTAALTMPGASATLDCIATTNNSNLYASRIIVVSVQAVTAFPPELFNRRPPRRARRELAGRRT